MSKASSKVFSCQVYHWHLPAFSRKCFELRAPSNTQGGPPRLEGLDPWGRGILLSKCSFDVGMKEQNLLQNDEICQQLGTLSWGRKDLFIVRQCSQGPQIQIPPSPPGGRDPFEAQFLVGKELFPKSTSTAHFQVWLWSWIWSRSGKFWRAEWVVVKYKYICRNTMPVGERTRYQ